MINYARLSPGPGFQLDRALLYYLQRLVTVPSARKSVANVIATALRSRHGSGADRAGTMDRRAVVKDIRRDGICMLAPLAPEPVIARMADYFLAQPVLAPDGSLSAIGDLPPNTPAAAYPLETILACPEAMSLLHDPSVLGIAADYLGCKPTLSSVGVRWSFPANGRTTDTQNFHRDVDDWRFLKVFVYLTDVDDKSGPHVYVKSTHKKGLSWKAKKYSVDGLAAQFGADNICTVNGPRGTSFIADTQGIHCGSAPLDRPRLIFQAQYSLLPIFAFQYEPQEQPGFSGDPYTDRLLMRQG